MMTNNNSSQLRMAPMSTSSTQFQNSPVQKQRYNPFAPTNKIPNSFQNDLNTKIQDLNSIHYPRAMASQSMIIMNRTAGKRATMCKLDGMARNVAESYKEDTINDIPKRQNHSFHQNSNMNLNIVSPLQNNASKHAYTFNHVQSMKNQNQKWSDVQNINQRESMDFPLTDRNEKTNQMQAYTHRPLYPKQSKQIKMQKKPYSQKSPQSTHSSHSAQPSNTNNQKKKFQFLKNRKQMPMIEKTQDYRVISNNSVQSLQQFSANHPHLKAPNFLSSTSNQLSPTDAYHSGQKQKILTPNKSETPTQPGYPPNFEFKKKTMKESPVQPAKISPRLDFSLMKKQNHSTEIITAKERRNCRPQRQIKLSDFQLLDKLGKGAFGDVYIAQEKNIGFMCVIKKMSKQRIKDKKVQEHILREIKIQSYLNHSNLTALYGCFHDQEYIYLVLEALPDGSLQQVKKKRKLPQKQTAAIIKQVSEGLKHMHQQYVIHRDLKPQNLFVNEKLIKIGDFGCSIYNRDLALRNTVVGCLQYSSPEQLSQEGYSDKIDSWSLGILTYELLYGKSPFESDIIKISMNKDQKAELSELSFPECIPIEKKTRDFIENLLSENPDLRMDMDGVLRHPFLRQDFSI